MGTTGLKISPLTIVYLFVGELRRFGRLSFADKRMYWSKSIK